MVNALLGGVVVVVAGAVAAMVLLADGRSAMVLLADGRSAAASVTLGNLAVLLQRDVKRLVSRVRSGGRGWSPSAAPFPHIGPSGGRGLWLRRLHGREAAGAVQPVQSRGTGQAQCQQREPRQRGATFPRGTRPVARVRTSYSGVVGNALRR
ncbi:hypothetical protein [Streptomyces sp. 5-10]|uniref:hypothetical protein n=1 Tax=Streptomyces sp. 5-10 TaxID=878925 RepID=UPI00168B9539|nr:hypothetical protein [Streptomyces sp. 5-10]MBD3010699.1 hypothetical protein [Streptomyces sp. 5-10]